MDRERPVIEFRDVCFGYRDQEVLHNVGFSVHAGEMVAVVGPNGGGKTTLLLLALGLLSPRLGTVRVLGRQPGEATARIGYVPQYLQFDLDFPVSVLDVVRMGLLDRRALGPFRRRDDAAARVALEKVGLRGKADRPFAALSGGERQRVLVAQALASGPELLLLDEPTANVDAVVEHGLYELLGELRRERTIVLVSHNVNVVTRHVTHVLCVNRSAALHPIGDIMSDSFTESHGSELALLLHNLHCHVLDHSRVMDTPHRGEASHS